MDDLRKSLVALGLPDKEAVVYIAILQSGKASPSDIAKRTHIRRTTIYLHLNALLARGFISKTIKGKRLLYVPEDPKKILDSFEKSRALFLQNVGQIEQLYKTARHQPTVRLYEGIEGIVQLLDELGSSLLPIDAFFSPEKYFRVVPKKDTDRFLGNVKKNGIMLRDLVERDAIAESFVKDIRKYQNDFHKVKLLPKDFSVSVDVLITGNKVFMISFDHLMGFVVENNEIARFHKSIHDFFWKNLP
mgnify:FL=1